ncbi:MAG: hypothetical protein HLUCCO02_05550 [Idiomarinaceae bacterium HL-53]|nr:MAG: hypothetical protein HLUCCO02_05550 [Idiomarinaceae bacterium HL-53]CUS48018.1 hypothetical protein Ga0003345_0957 [Idiomarinaceae bacterium HL-53]
MDSNSFKPAGIAAIALAVLFPIYWLYVVSFSATYEGEFWLEFEQLNLWDLLFVVIGALEIWVYLAFRKLVSYQLNGSLLSILLLIMVGLVGLFHATVVVDLFIAFGLAGAFADTMITVAVTLGLVFLFLYAVVALIFALVMLKQFTSLSSLLKVFAVGLLVASVFQFTVVLGVLNILLFPILMIILSIEFFRGEQSIEVV